MQSGIFCNRIDFLYHKKIVDTIKFPPVIASFQYSYVKFIGAQVLFTRIEYQWNLSCPGAVHTTGVHDGTFALAPGAPLK